MPNELDDLAARISDLASSAGRTVAVAESLTGGMVSAALAASSGAGEWYRGGLVAYSSQVKHDVLDVPDGPVVDPDAARVMAERVRELLGADIAVALTGAGGPDPQDGQDPGTVFLAVADGAHTEVVRRVLTGEPVEVCSAAGREALRFLVDRIG